MEVKAGQGKLTGYFVVRDKDGHPKFDDWHNIPKEYLHGLTEADKAYIEKMRGNT